MTAPCPECGGRGEKTIKEPTYVQTGWEYTGAPCPACHGAGAAAATEPERPSFASRSLSGVNDLERITCVEAAARFCEAMAMELTKEPEPGIERAQALLRGCAVAIRAFCVIEELPDQEPKAS